MVVQSEEEIGIMEDSIVVIGTNDITEIIIVIETAVIILGEMITVAIIGIGEGMVLPVGGAMIVDKDMNQTNTMMSHTGREGGDIASLSYVGLLFDTRKSCGSNTSVVTIILRS